MDDETAWGALAARDARFDGRFFVGVTSTGIYCRPICRVRLPRRANCRFFNSAARAEQAGFRPCLRCRPELAPGLSLMDSSATLAQAAARMIDGAVQAGETASMPAVAARLGVSDRHLRRIFIAQHGVKPVEYLSTRRLLLAKQLLTDTTQPITQVALASGFASLRRFNAAFVERYRLSPSRLRRSGAEPAVERPALRLRLGYRPPFDAHALFGFLARRAMADVEVVDGLRYARSLRLQHGGTDLSGWVGVQVDAARCELVVDVAPTFAPALGLLTARLRGAFDLDADPALIDPVLAQLPLPPMPGLRLPGTLDSFETAVRVILGQQITVKAARTLAQRLIERFGEPIGTPWPGITRLFPSAAVIAAATPEAIGTLGIVRQRVRALQALAAAMADGSLVLAPGAEAAPLIAQLQALHGIGPWSAQVIALRTLGWRDAWPSADVGLWQALGSRDPKHIEALAEGWRPFRSHALMRLWHQVETAA